MLESQCRLSTLDDRLSGLLCIVGSACFDSPKTYDRSKTITIREFDTGGDMGLSTEYNFGAFNFTLVLFSVLSRLVCAVVQQQFDCQNNIFIFEGLL